MKKWEINIKGNIHKIEFKSFFKNILIIDGKEYNLKSEYSFVSKIDYKFYLDNSVLHFVKVGKKTDISLNGKYIDSQKNYSPLPQIPKWVYILSAISIIGGFLLFGGLIALIVGIIFSHFYFTNFINGNPKYTKECFIACTAFQIILCFTILSTMAR
ncbi:hypothetical protein [Clostridium sp. BJN0001]|uniref:hypothetical protein n=1 Tax=Clostridium sp. BJN0001 TaxID=2930219 RepID=UPI001FD49FC7|nr:hypothetical protein [Clostridium sp. BJN0001]